MAGYTELLNLYFKNPLTDGSDNFNIETMLNENWRKIDKALGPLLPLSILPAKSVTYETGAATLATEESAPINFVLELSVEPVVDVNAITLVAFHAPNWPSATNGLIVRYPSAATGEMVDEPYTFTDSGGDAIGVDSFGNYAILAVALDPLGKEARLLNPSISGGAKSRFEVLEGVVDRVDIDLTNLTETVSKIGQISIGHRTGTGSSSITLSFPKTPNMILYLSEDGGSASSYFWALRVGDTIKYVYESGSYLTEKNIGIGSLECDVSWGTTTKITFATGVEFSASRFNSSLNSYSYIGFM